MVLSRLLSAALITTLLLTTACSHIPFPIVGERLPGREDGPQRKTVESKEAPSRLVAIDGTVCLVSASRYGGVEPGDRVWCDWRPRGG